MQRTIELKPIAIVGHRHGDAGLPRRRGELPVIVVELGKRWASWKIEIISRFRVPRQIDALDTVRAADQEKAIELVADSGLTARSQVAAIFGRNGALLIDDDAALGD